MPRKLSPACRIRTCPNLKPCPDHPAQRATRQQRGYGRDHYRLRDALAPRVEAGLERCARCKQQILPGQAWHLDHSDDRTTYLGPSHEHCNTSAGGQAAHR